jgi:hypothetical protein
MPEDRKDYLRKHLWQELATIDDDRSRTRVNRLLSHVDEYVERLRGFAALPGIRWENLSASDGFAVIQVALEVLTTVVESGGAPQESVAKLIAISKQLDAIADAPNSNRALLELGTHVARVRQIATETSLEGEEAAPRRES